MSPFAQQSSGFFRSLASGVTRTAKSAQEFAAELESLATRRPELSGTPVGAYRRDGGAPACAERARAEYGLERRSRSFWVALGVGASHLQKFRRSPTPISARIDQRSRSGGGGKDSTSHSIHWCSLVRSELGSVSARLFRNPS